MTLGATYTVKVTLKCMYKLIMSVPKNSSDKSSIRCPDHEAGDEETTGNASSVRPTGDKEVHQEDDPEGGKRESTCMKREV